MKFGLRGTILEEIILETKVSQFLKKGKLT